MKTTYGYEILNMVDLFADALTKDIAEWYKDWSGGDELGFDAKASICIVILKRLSDGVEI